MCIKDFLFVEAIIYIALTDDFSIREVKVTNENVESIRFGLQFDSCTFLFKDDAIEYLKAHRDKKIRVLKQKIHDLESLPLFQG